MDDLIGKVFNKLKVISEGTRSARGVRRWLCLCSCGNNVYVTKYNLTHNISKSCGCFNREANLIGMKYGKLTVIERAKNIGIKKAWLCECECGKICVVKANHLKTGNTQSCGCFKKATDKNNLKSKILRKADLVKRVYLGYKKSAKKRGLPFLIDVDFFKDTIKKNCFYCNSLPSNKVSSFSDILKYNGLDRKDNNKGYTKENCVPCCSFCNRSKNNHSLKEFQEWVVRLGEKYLKEFKYD